MDEAVPNLPDMRPNQRTDLRGGVTKYTALAIKAMANLELKNYQAVADATGTIINSNKFTSLAKGSSYELYNYTKGDQSLFHKNGSEEIIELLAGHGGKTKAQRRQDYDEYCDAREKLNILREINLSFMKAAEKGDTIKMEDQIKQALKYLGK
jgi:hypothetical protein